MHMHRTAILVTAASLALAACSTGADVDPSGPPPKPKDFCHAMQAAATAAAPAAEALDGLFTTIDEFASSATAVEIEALNQAGTDTVTKSQAYADALGTAAELSEDANLSADITTLQRYWLLYAIGLGQVAEGADSYGDLIDQSQALTTSDEASELVEQQPIVQGRINDGYLAECTN